MKIIAFRLCHFEDIDAEIECHPLESDTRGVPSPRRYATVYQHIWRSEKLKYKRRYGIKAQNMYLGGPTRWLKFIQVSIEQYIFRVPSQVTEMII